MKPLWNECLKEMQAHGYAVCVITPVELGPVTREQAEEWMYDCINTCREITEEDESHGL